VSYALRYTFVIALVVVTFAVELVGNMVTNSLGLFSDAIHLVVDLVPLVMGQLALKIQKRGGSSTRVEWWTTAVNITMLFLFGVVFSVYFIERLVNPKTVSTDMLLFATLGCIGNFLQLLLARGLQGAHAHHHTGQGQLLHFGVDSLASCGVLIGAIGLWYTGSYLADELATFAVIVASFVGGGILLNNVWRTSESDHASHAHTHHH
jgi:cation diffusion facilitator family transporter